MINFYNNNIFFKIINYSIIAGCGLLWGLGHWQFFCFIRFFGLIPFLYIILYRKSLCIDSLIFGFMTYLVNFYWLLTTFIKWGNYPIWAAFLLLLAICSYFGLQYLIIALITRFFYQKNQKLIFLFPFIFTGIDYLFPKFFNHSIADSMLAFLHFVQIIDLIGIQGLLLILILINLNLFYLLKALLYRKKLVFGHFIFLIPFFLTIIYGYYRINYFERLQPHLETTRAAMIQGNITGTYQRYLNRDSIKTYKKLTRQAIESYELDFIIWPESVFPYLYNGKEQSLPFFVDHYDLPMIIGLLYWDQKRNLITNSSLLIKRQKQVQRYDKRHLVLMGEYIPFETALPFLKKFTVIQKSYQKGKTPAVFTVNQKVRACISICFEDIFPSDARQKIQEGCNLMVNLTNDIWFGQSLGPRHHSTIARLRAIENRRSFFRCTPTGLSTATDLTGRIVQKGGFWQEQIIIARLPLYTKRTIYNYLGPVAAYLSLAIICLTFLLIILQSFFAPQKSIDFASRD